MRNSENIRAIHPVNEQIAVKFDSVSFSYGDVKVLQNVSFHLHRGEFVALVGPNGSGKTTVLKLLLGLEKPGAGKIELFGLPQGETPAWRDRLGYVPQQPPADQTFPITVRDVVRMGLLRPLKGYADIARNAHAAVELALQQACLADLAERSYRALSGGQRRRVLVARALASQPDLLILDEPTANMDGESEARLFETLGALKGRTTILIVTHDTEFVSVLTDRVLCLGLERQAGACDEPHASACEGRGMVQHRIEADARAAGHGAQGARVLHGENIPADECYE
jgi:zinc transport system ATP-binding protein